MIHKLLFSILCYCLVDMYLIMIGFLWSSFQAIPFENYKQTFFLRRFIATIFPLNVKEILVIPIIRWKWRTYIIEPAPRMCYYRVSPCPLRRMRGVISLSYHIWRQKVFSISNVGWTTYGQNKPALAISCAHVRPNDRWKRNSEERTVSTLLRFN